MIYSIKEDVNRLYANLRPFYIRDMSIHGFGHAQGVLNKSPIDTKGQLYKEKCWERSLKEKEGETLGLELQQ